MGAALDKFLDAKYNGLAQEYKNDLKKHVAKYEMLKNVDVFVLDNSIRESTVGAVKGHTVNEKWQIYNEVKQCGFTHIIVAAFHRRSRVDDVFVQELVKSGEDVSRMFAFSEIAERRLDDFIPDTETVPSGIRKVKEFGLQNVIIDTDIGDNCIDMKRFSFEAYCKLLKERLIWIHENINENSLVFVNIRDLKDVMPTNPDRLVRYVEFMGRLPSNIRPRGIMFEEPGGGVLPEEVCSWTKMMRRVANLNDWDALILVHVHERFGFADSTALHVLMGGGNGVWCSVCCEGAAVGHASSCGTIMNLVRLGNNKVLEKFNCSYLRTAAINVTKITTGKDPHPTQPIYGSRALDLVFEMGNDKFDLASFFEEKTPMRISTLASPRMIQQRLIDVFGENEQFTEEMGENMLDQIEEDLKHNRKEEYMSRVGLALLFDRAGGKLTPAIRDEVAKMELNQPFQQQLIDGVRSIWDSWDNMEDEELRGDDCLEFRTFYESFMAPYFGCYSCEDTQRGLQAIDMDKDGRVEWNEFLVYLKWALNEYEEVKTPRELVDVAISKGLIPAMMDEVLKRE